MQKALLKKHSFLPTHLLTFVVTVPVAVILFLAVWLVLAAVVENIRFADTSEEILGLVATASEFASHSKTFAQDVGEDVIQDLIHSGAITPDSGGGISTAWHSPIKGFVPEPSHMRLEMQVPARDCRRLALFLEQNPKDLGLQTIEAREGEKSVWHNFYGDKNISFSPDKLAEAACGTLPTAYLALVFQLR